jgi:hypothetical protein
MLLVQSLPQLHDDSFHGELMLKHAVMLFNMQAFLAGKATAGLTLAGLRALSKGVTPPDLDSLRVSAPLCISTAGEAS